MMNISPMVLAIGVAVANTNPKLSCRREKIIRDFKNKSIARPLHAPLRPGTRLFFV